MRKVTGLMIASLAVWAFCGLVPASAQTPPTAPAAVKPAEPPAVPPQAPPMRRAEIRREITGALGWKVGIPANAFSQLTFLEAAEKAEALGVMSIEGFSSQRVSADIAKNLDANLSPDELTAIKAHLTALHLHMPAYHAGDVGKDETTWSKLFDSAKALGIETIICNPDPASLTSEDTLPQLLAASGCEVDCHCGASHGRCGSLRGFGTFASRIREGCAARFWRIYRRRFSHTAHHFNR